MAACRSARNPRPPGVMKGLKPALRLKSVWVICGSERPGSATSDLPMTTDMVRQIGHFRKVP
jgi:hypothetical protein